MPEPIEDVPPFTPAWSLTAAAAAGIEMAAAWPVEVTRDWALGGSTGAGARVCMLDSGVEEEHPDVRHVDAAWYVQLDDDGGETIAEDERRDVAGHGTACAGIIRSLAPECSITSVRVLDPMAAGTAGVLTAGLRWAVAQDFDIINLSLSTTRRDVAAALRELADGAYFRRTLLVAAAHNMRLQSFPWRFASVISAGSHEEDDPYLIYSNPRPPVEFFARGVDIPVAWPGGLRRRMTGNSFAAAHLSGLCALMLAKHPWLTAFQVKNVLHLMAANVGEAR